MRDDRHYGAMGGAGKMHFVAVDRYAARYGIEGVDFDRFERLLAALDTEYMTHLAERDEERRREAEANTGKT